MQVSYSVGVAGDYLLHVRLRSQAAAVPGSPFALRVEPGPPNALSTALPALRLISEVGEQCRVVMRTLDKMGNECTVGGGEGVVECSCNDKAVSTEVGAPGGTLSPVPAAAVSCSPSPMAARLPSHVCQSPSPYLSGTLDARLDSASTRATAPTRSRGPLRCLKLLIVLIASDCHVDL